MTLTFRLPDPPPSANRAWRKFRNRMVRSPEWNAWAEMAELQFRLQSRDNKLPEICYWRTHLFIPRSKSGFDLDNSIKAVHDALHRSGATPDDRYLVKSTQEFWGGDYLIVHVKHERLDLWQTIMNTSKPIIKRMEKALNSRLFL